MAPRAIALFSGGLDSMLAVRVAQSCGVEVRLLHFRTPFTTLTELAATSAGDLGLSLDIVEADDRYLQLITQPRFGRCVVATPCLDCREHLFRQAADVLPHHDAQFVITGEVLGQRRWGQRRRDLEALAIRAGLEGLIERPLSALLLEPTVPQTQGWIDRGRLYDIKGKGRRRQLELAERFGLKSLPAPLARCCLLAETKVGSRVLRANERGVPLTAIRCELLAVADPIPLDDRSEITISRNAVEGERLRAIARRHSEYVVLIEPANFRGPLAVVSGEDVDDDTLAIAAASIRERARNEVDHPAEYWITRGGNTERLSL